MTKLPFQQVCRPFWLALSASPRVWLTAAGLALLAGAPGLAGVRFENCQGGADGSLTCDTVPTGNTLAEEEEARYGLFQNASPGWNEFDPFAGYADEFGGT